MNNKEVGKKLKGEKKILLVEDDYILSDLYRQRFEFSGFLVDVSKDGSEALGKIKMNKPDLIILDINMPRYDGKWLLQQLKEEGLIDSVKIILFSALCDRGLIEKLKEEYEIKYYFSKSESTPKELVETINKII